jgi:hypothetical protein
MAHWRRHDRLGEVQARQARCTSYRGSTDTWILPSVRERTHERGASASQRPRIGYKGE